MLSRPVLLVYGDDLSESPDELDSTQDLAAEEPPARRASATTSTLKGGSAHQNRHASEPSTVPASTLPIDRDLLEVQRRRAALTAVVIMVRWALS